MSGDQWTRQKTTTTVALIASFALAAWMFSPIWKPLLLGTVFATTVARLHEWLAQRMWSRRYLSAAVVTGTATIVILVPITVLAFLAVRQALEALSWVKKALDSGGVRAILRPLPDHIERWLQPLVPKDLSASASSAEAGWWAALQLQSLVTTLSQFAFDVALMMITFFFVLADGHKLAGWLGSVSPLGKERTAELVREFQLVGRATIGSNLITGVVQAMVATAGYVIAGTPQPIFFGLLTLLTSFIPTVGTALVALPLAGLTWLSGRPWAALFLALWSLFAVGTVDNFLRPWLIKSDVHIHGAVLFFSLLGGLLIFGVAGLVAGPLVLALFLAILRFHARDRRVDERVASAIETAPANDVAGEPKTA